MATEKFINTVNKRIGKTVHSQNMINNGDSLLIALSGGKDSMVLLESMSDRRKVLKQKFSLMAVYIKISNIGYKADIDYLKQICDFHQVPFHVLEFNISFTQEERAAKGACFLCSWHRRKALFEFAKSNGCNKIAFGHHMDDAIETLFLNMIYHGSISSMPFSIEMLGGAVKIIRPLLEIGEEDLIDYASLRGYRKILKDCPYEHSKRKEIKSVISQLKEMSKHAGKNILRSMDNSFPEYLPKWNKKI